MLAVLFASLFFYTSNHEFINLDMVEKITVIKSEKKIQVSMRIHEHNYWHVMHSDEELRSFIEHNFDLANIPEFLIDIYKEETFEDLGD